tara:strand:+ start:1341 stop:2243 length:903 start_codon:yes stop_codon:yes gene_type:complete
MSKIQIEEIDSVTTNGNLKLTPNGTGIVDVSGESDGTLQLDNVKVKAPPATAQQNTTLILPQNDLTAGQYLNVNSITGSGSTAVGQLEGVAVTPPTADVIDAANFTTGQVPDARYSIPGTAGGGLQFVSKQVPTSNGTVTTLDFPLETDTNYKIIGTVLFSSNSTYPLMDWLMADGSVSAIGGSGGIGYTFWYDANASGTYSNNSNQNYIVMYPLNWTMYYRYGFEFDIHNTPGHVAVNGRLHANQNANAPSKLRLDASYMDNSTWNSRRIHTLRFRAGHGTSHTFETGTQVHLFKYSTI